MNPGSKILILEKSLKLLSKVRVSGGGRCNVTHHCFDPINLSKHYPRGEKQLRSVFKKYQASHTLGWFASRGVELKVEEDGRMFPLTDNSETIIECFLSETRKYGIAIKTGVSVVSIKQGFKNFEIKSEKGDDYLAARILIATGGNPKPEAYAFIRDLGHTIKPPIPSLFTFNDATKVFSDLMGIAVPQAEIRIVGTKFKQEGPLLITHWGLSGPAVIKLSAWAAEYLYSVHYNFTVLVRWIGPAKEDWLREFLQSQKATKPKQKIHSHPSFDLPQRLWVRLCAQAGIPEERIWGEIAGRNMNKLLENLIRCPFVIKGKTTFKEEFVTCGGVDLKEVDLETMESKKVKGLFFAGEVLDIDGETGGFNFQAAWSTAFLAAKSAFTKEV
jgi:flavoprotein, HI0933 family